MRVCYVTQSCLTLCCPLDCSPPGSSVHGILQARILEWVAMPSSRASFWPRDQTHISCVFCDAGKFFTAEPAGKPYISSTIGSIIYRHMISQVKSLKRSELVLSSIKQRYYNLLHRSSGGINGLICLSHLAQAWSVCVCVCWSVVSDPLQPYGL